MSQASRCNSHSSNGEHELHSEDTLMELKRWHDRAYSEIQKALRLDEQSKRDAAAHHYGLGLQHIAKAMKINCKGTGCVGPQWDRAREMQQKMKQTAIQMKQRLESLEEEQISFQGASGGACAAPAMDHSDSLPSYAEAAADAREVLRIPQGVQLFFIDSRGHVSAPGSPGPLKVYWFPKGKALAVNQPPAFLQVGEWLYPLLPGRSPSLETADGVFMFPDVSSQDQGASVGIIFSRQVNRSDQAKFESLIRQLTALHQAPATQIPAEDPREVTQEPRADEASSQETSDQNRETCPEAQTGKDMGQKIAKGIEIGAEWISWGVVKGAEIGSRLVGSGAKRLKQHIQPDEQPAEIDEKYQTGMVYAKKATDVAVKVSVVVLDSVCFLTKRIAEEVGPVISQQADKMLTSGDDETDGKRKEVIDGLVQVTASGIRGFGQVYRSLEVGAIQLAKSISKATVETVTHKYGDDAGKLTDNSLATVGNIGVSAHNFNHLGVKAVAKRTAKDTSKVVIRDFENASPKDEKPK